MASTTSTPLPTPATTTAAPARSYVGPLVMMTLLFFIFGAVTQFNEILMVYLRHLLHLKLWQAALVQTAFFSAYFVMALPAGLLLRRVGYQRGIIIGLLVMAAGALLFIPAANHLTFGGFLLGLGVLGVGLTLLQTAANPYVSVLGPARSAASRVSLVGAANNLAGALAPIVGRFLLFGSAAGAATYVGTSVEFVKRPYFILACGLVALAGIFAVVRLPQIVALADDVDDGAAPTPASAPSLASAHLWWGVLAIFVYVGAEVGLGSFIIPYAQQLKELPFFTGLIYALDVLYTKTLVSLHLLDRGALSSLSYTPSLLTVAAALAGLYWLGSLIGRTFGIPLLRVVSGPTALLAVSALALALTLGAAAGRSELGLGLVVLCGLCNSVMWPIIFPLAIRGLGALTQLGSSLLIMAIVGGAIVPPLMGLVADRTAVNTSLLVPALCYAYLVFYAVRGYRSR